MTRPLRPWLYGIAANLARHTGATSDGCCALTRERASIPFLLRTTAALGVWKPRPAVASLQRALADLRPRDREILLLHAWAELSDGEIAAALSLPVGTVKSRLHRTRERLRNRLGANGQSAAKTLSATGKEQR